MRPRRSETTNSYKFICIPCRYTAKRLWSEDFKHRCPECRQPLICVGSKIPIPRKSDDKAWEALAINKRVRLQTRGTKKVPTTLRI
jgi:hypothetical protein